ncbi:ATP-binding protein [Candidatus Pacearchaeota archaeon]|nr:ATP-binding protein [Candidatus Pacearchaeota archaeon]
MEKERLREILLDQNMEREIEFVQREKYQDLLKDIKTPFVKILTGIRRSGKSTLLIQLKKRHDGTYVNFDDERFVNFKVDDFQVLYELSIEIFGNKKYFYFDEIQNIVDWERFVRRLSESGGNVFVTGSNATMLSKELGTHLTGRYISYTLYPFSFREYLKFKKMDNLEFTTKNKAEIKRNFRKYLTEGGLPEYLMTGNRDYLKMLFESILYRDVMTRYKLTNERALKELVYIAANNISKEISFNSIKKMIGLGSSTTVSDYFSYLENTYLLFLVPKYSHSLKKQIHANKKLYMIDNAIAHQLGFSFSENKGKLLENLVFVELKRRGKEIYYFQEKGECDFILRENRIKEAIQVCYEINDGNKEREIAGLAEAMKKFKLKEGIILTMDQEEEIARDNLKIKIIPVWKWLLEK